MSTSKEDAYKGLLEKLRPDIERLCDSLKTSLLANPVTEGKPAASGPFSLRNAFADESGSMEGPQLTAKQQIELLTLMVSAADKAGLQFRFLSSDELKAEGRWPAEPNVTPFKPK